MLWFHIINNLETYSDDGGNPWYIRHWVPTKLGGLWDIHSHQQKVDGEIR